MELSSHHVTAHALPSTLRSTQIALKRSCIDEAKTRFEGERRNDHGQ
jgi:hypothetical protein